MLKGLEVAERKLSELERTGRIDAEFFQKRHLLIDEKLVGLRCDSIATAAAVSDGNYFSISESFVEEGIPYYRGQDAVGHFFIEQSTPNKITREAFETSYMQRSHLRQGDVLLSIVGTVGETSLVTTEQKATCSCKLAILRPKTIEPAYLAAYLTSGIGRTVVERWKRGAVQMGLLLEDMDQLPVPRFSNGLEIGVEATIESAYESLEESNRLFSQAEQHLISELGLDSWQAPEPLSYVRNSSAAFAAGRLDAEFFNPGIDQLLKRLSCDGLKIRDVAPARKERFSPNETGEFHYIEIGTLNNDGTAQAQCLPQREAPSRATQHVRTNDVITSTVRPNRRLSASISEGQDGFVCSSGFVVLQPKQISGDVLLTYLRLPIICKLMDLYTSASMYPAISESDLLNLPIPKFSTATEKAVEQSLQSARQAKQRATQLLEATKRAVEIAIEQSEAEALAYLHDITAS